MKIKIKYNAPVTLTIALISALVLAVDLYLSPGLIAKYFAVPGKGAFTYSNFVDYLRLFSHILGHSGWTHLLGNFAFILLLGPQLEEKYRSVGLLLMILATAMITGVINILFMPKGLMGASGIVFMMILLSSFTRVKNGEIPLTFILVVILYLSKEIISAFGDDDISQLAHVVGGLCGSMFGFLKTGKGGGQS